METHLRPGSYFGLSRPMASGSSGKSLYRVGPLHGTGIRILRRPPMLSRSLVGCALLLLLVAAVAPAATTPPGMNIRWDHCYDDGGTANKLFACDRNIDSERLVCSFVLDSPM